MRSLLHLGAWAFRSRWVWLIAAGLLCVLSFHATAPSEKVEQGQEVVAKFLAPWQRRFEGLSHEQRVVEVNSASVLQRLIHGRFKKAPPSAEETTQSADAAPPLAVLSNTNAANEPVSKSSSMMRSTLMLNNNNNNNNVVNNKAVKAAESLMALAVKLPADIADGGALVADEITAVDVPKPESNVVLIKTHKTASTTLASILFRFGMHRNLRFFVPHYHYVDLKRRPLVQPKSNVSMYHHFTPSLQTEPLLNWYKEWVPMARFVTILRDPYQRVLSEYFYFFQPESPNIPLYDLLTNKTHDILSKLHFMSHDLGIYSDEDLNLFLSQNHKLFDMFLITELFDESLVLMKRRYNWDIEDLLYLRLLDACRDGRRSWDRKRVHCAKTDPIDEPSRLILKEAIRHDEIIYNFARGRVQKEIDAQPPDFWEELNLFRAKQQQLMQVCGTTDTISWLSSSNDLNKEQKRICSIFRMNDLQFEHVVKLSGGLVNQIMVDYEIRLIERQNNMRSRFRSI